MATSDRPSSSSFHGYPKELFKNGVERKYICNECSFVLREPVQAVCGHRFCKTCLASNLRIGAQLKCKQCERDGADRTAEEDFSIISPEQIHPDNAVKREMNKLKVACANQGCSWHGILQEYEDHYLKCTFRQIKCQHCGSNVKFTVLRHHEDSECRILCNACNKHIWLKDMAVHRDQECLAATVVCFECGQTGIVRETLRNHEQSLECRREPIICPACCGRVARKEYQEHFRRMHHEVWLAQSLDDITNRTQIFTTESIQEISRQLATQVTLVEEKVSRLDRKLHDVGSQLSIRTSTADTVRIPNIDENIHQTVEVQLRLMNIVLDDTTRKFEGETSALHRTMEKIITAVEKLERHNVGISTKMQQINNQIQTFERTIDAKNMAFAELELKAQALVDASYDGILLWRVPEFSKLRQNAIHGRTVSIYSPPFYTSRTGYKMCTRLYPNGDGMGKGSHLSLFFTIMRGNYDPLLKWPFSKSVTFCLISQDGKEHVVDSFVPDLQSSSFKRPTSDMNIASGCPLFVRLELLQNPVNGFLKDDTIFLKITVDTS